MRLVRHNRTAWQLAAPTPAARGARRGAPATAPDIPDRFLLDGVDVALTRDATPAAARRGVAAPLELEIECAPGERAVVALRLPSHALTFHAPVERVARRDARQVDAGGTEVFRIGVPAAAPDPTTGRVQRGLLTKAAKLIVLKVRQHLVDAAVAKGTRIAMQGLERLWWKTRGLEEGWKSVDAATLRAGELRRAAFPRSGGGERALLLVHGTFSNAAGAFAPLADAPGDFFSAIRPLYGDRVYAFDHFTLSKSPADNIEDLLKGLPGSVSLQFDVITHSRGGLVLRHLVERRDLFGSRADRFRLNRAILVASPNAGTPLATPKRWEQTVGLVANLLEMFPDNPWTTGAEFVANGIVWIAAHLGSDVPGLAAMDGDGEGIGALQRPPGPPSEAYSALVANYNPEGARLARLLDAGVDGFFAGANDLVVPSEGGWQVDGAAGGAIPAERVGCFGPGGNLPPPATDPITHLNFFGEAGTVDFLVRTLRGDAATTTAIDLERPLPTRRLFRGGAPAPGAAPRETPRAPRAKESPVTTPPPVPGPASPPPGRPDATLQVMILQGRDGADSQILATYGSARVVQVFPTRNPGPKTRRAARRSPRQDKKPLGPGERFRQIIDFHRDITMSLEGRVPKGKSEVPKLPNDDDLKKFGTLLFDALFHDDVKRLYDVARSEQRDRPLNLVFTCTIPWVASKPWEFAYDRARNKFLVTEEVHFVRNVFTPVPAQHPPLTWEPLRMLVVMAQPLGTAELSSADEEARIRDSFRTLIDSGLVDVHVLTKATPARLHQTIEARALEAKALGQPRGFHIVHFIGHGDFDREANGGVLLFTTASGEMHPMKTRELREVLCGRGIQLVFLNACDTARDATTVSNRGVAQALVEGGVPAVVANQYKVLDPSAVAFAERFYWSLSHGGSLGEAAREARIALNYALEGDIIDWAVPVLYARDPDLRLCAPRERVAVPSTMASEVSKITPSSPSASRSRSATPPIRVCVADLTRAYPGLEEVVPRLNATQDVAEFALVRIVLPLGIWRETDHGLYLNADRFADRLLPRLERLATDYLICVTDRRLVGSIGKPDNLVENLFVWGDPQCRHKIFVISTAEFPLPPRGMVTNRFFANVLAAVLANDLVQPRVRRNVIHNRPPRDCPFYYNPERDFDQLASRLRFDTTCRKLLERHLEPVQRAAIDALLSAFFDAAPGAQGTPRPTPRAAARKRRAAAEPARQRARTKTRKATRRRA